MNIRYAIQFFIPLIFIYFMSATAQPLPATAVSQKQNQKLVKGTAEMDNFDLLPAPLNVSDFVQNVKHCIDQDCLLQAGFFSKENLINFTNGKTFENFGDNNQHFVVHDINIQGISHSIGFSRKNTSKKESGNLAANFDGQSLNVDYIIKLFGSPKKIENLYTNVLPAHLPALEPKTHKYGHSEILQTIIRINSTTEITTLTLKDGTVFKLNVEQSRERK